tara:strand:+ start:2643 stop:4271 length:1629 start_codon:yes stop_codon:yes gene_type:complete
MDFSDKFKENLDKFKENLIKIYNKLERHEWYFIFYDILIFLPVCVASIFVFSDNDKHIDGYYGVLITTFIAILIIPCLVYVIALYKNNNFNSFNKQAKDSGTYLYQKINYDNIRYVDDEYKLIIPSTMRKIINFFFPFFDWYSPYKINHSIDLDKIINKDYLDEPQETDKEEVKKKITNIKNIKKLIQNIKYCKIFGSIIFIIPFMAFVALNIYCFINEFRKDISGCDISGNKEQIGWLPILFFSILIILNTIYIAFKISYKDPINEFINIAKNKVDSDSQEALLVDRAKLVVENFFGQASQQVSKTYDELYREDPKTVIDKTLKNNYNIDIYTSKEKKQSIDNITKQIKTIENDNRRFWFSVESIISRDTKPTATAATAADATATATNATADDIMTYIPEYKKNKMTYNDLAKFETRLIEYKLDILEKSLRYKIHDIYRGGDIFTSLNILGKNLIVNTGKEEKISFKSKYCEQIGKCIYILTKGFIVLWILYVVLKSKNPKNLFDLSLKLLVIFWIIYTVLGGAWSSRLDILLEKIKLILK